MRQVVKLGHPALRSQAHPCNLILMQKETILEPLQGSTEIQVMSALSAYMQKDVRRMMKGDSTHLNAVGLAAPQLGCSMRIFAMIKNANRLQYSETVPKVQIVINPVIVEKSSDDIEIDWEGCLSIPGYNGLVRRYRDIKVEYFNRAGHLQKKFLTGYASRVFQHECDHLDGILFIDSNRLAHPRALFSTEDIDQLELGSLEPLELMQRIQNQS